MVAPEQEQFVVLEYTIADGSRVPALVAAHPNTAAYVISIFQLIDFADKQNMKLTAMDKIIEIYRSLIENPLGELDTAPDE